MSVWKDRVLRDFVPDLEPLWIAVDPDNVLLDEGLLGELRQRGFDVIPFEDSIAFRAEFERRYRTEWQRGRPGPAKAVILHWRSDDLSGLPWDYLQSGRQVRLSLADLLPKLAPGVTRQVGPEHLGQLFEAQSDHATQVLGESATKEFVLLHVFRLSPPLIRSVADLWRELLKIHYAESELPAQLASHVEAVLSRVDAFRGLPVANLFGSRSYLLNVLQNAWSRHLKTMGVAGRHVGDPMSDEYAGAIRVPFDDPGIWSTVDSLFLEGALHPVRVTGLPSTFPRKLHVGVVQDQGDIHELVTEGLKALKDELPDEDGSHRDWLQYARKQGELLARFHGLDNARFEALRAGVEGLQSAADTRLQEWVRHHFASLPSLSPVNAPMVHHIPSYLAARRDTGETKIALLVFDGLAIDQWARIRGHLAEGMPDTGFDEMASFAWLPTLTSVSRQAIFSGLKPREFASSIDITAKEPGLWTRFWADRGLRANEVFYRKGIKRIEELDELTTALSAPSLKVAGIVVDMVDELVHGAQLGKRGVARLIDHWCQTGFVERLFTRLHELGYHVYVTADHGNVDAIGSGRINQGVAAELRGERVRTYRSQPLVEQSAQAYPSAVQMPLPGLPADYLPLFAGPRSAFVTEGEQLVVHGGISVEELIVPFVKVKQPGFTG
ncbi:BREX-3 system phosphatase PglZ [Thermomonas mangrovi]|uniref:BREX-3 system phosphatase PglZ n=1 Tax=Thermomonas mangrovi TaxID=2993316 RepID=UPI0023082EEB